MSKIDLDQDEMIVVGIIILGLVLGITFI